MKKTLKQLSRALLLTFLIPSIVLADNIAIVNSSQATLYGSQLEMGPVAMDTKGNQYVVVTSSGGLSQSVIPESGSVGLNGGLVVPQALFLVGTDTIEAASTTTTLVLTSHAARVGDWITATGGTAANVNVSIPVCAVPTANAVTLCTPLPATPSTDAIKIERPNPIRAVAFNGTQQATDTIPPLVIRNEGASAINTANLSYGVISVSRAGALHTQMNTAFNGTNGGKDIAADEDVAFAPSDAVVKAGGVNNSGATEFNTTNLDVTPIGVGRFGNVLSTIFYDPNIDTDYLPVRREDTAFGGDDAVMMVGAVQRDTVTTYVSGQNDIIPLNTDVGGRLITTQAPTAEMWSSCGTATASTGDTAIKASVASNRIYVTAVTCSSSDADNATNINFKDGTTTIAVGGVSQMAAGADGSFTASFPTPLRLTSATAFNFATVVSTSSVICCGTGYISVT